MLSARFERLAEGFQITARTLQFEGVLYAAFVCAAGWLATGWVGQEWSKGAGLQTQHLFFGAPMALAGVVLVRNALLGIAGKVVVRGERSELTMWEGVGFLGAKQRCASHEVMAVDIGPLLDRSARRSPEVVRVHLKGESKRMVKFGMRLNAPRRGQIVEMLKRELGK